MGTEGPLYNRLVRPCTPQPTTPVAEAAPTQHQVAPADHAAPADHSADTPDTDVADTHQNDIVEAPRNKPDFAPANTPRNDADNVSGPPSGMDPSVTMRPQQHQL